MSTLTRFLLALWLVIGCIVGSPATCIASDAIVGLHADTETTRPTVKLSDLFTNVPADIDTDIAQAPLPGRDAVYDSGILVKLAAKYHLEWHPINAGEHVTLRTPCVKITPEAIRAAVIKKIKDTGAHGLIDVSFDNRTLEIDLPADQSAEFDLNNFDFDPLSKRFHADLTGESGQGPFTMPLTGRVVVKHHVPVLARRLESGTIIGAADIDWTDIPEERMNESVVTDADQLIGRELRHTTTEGDILHSNDVLPPRFVKRGTLVTLKIETPFMTLTAQGRALQDGAQGETVRVLNTASNRMIEGTVDGTDTVTVHTAQKLAAAE